LTEFVIDYPCGASIVVTVSCSLMFGHAPVEDMTVATGNFVLFLLTLQKNIAC